MKLAIMTSLALLSMSPALSFADSHCGCSRECQENCKKGKTEGCKCKSCDCKKTGQCSDPIKDTKSK